MNHSDILNHSKFNPLDMDGKMTDGSGGIVYTDDVSNTFVAVGFKKFYFPQMMSSAREENRI